MLMFGGGHAATPRTDIDAFDLDPPRGRPLTWVPLYPSTPAAAMTSVNQDKDRGSWKSSGHPMARHSYDMAAVMEVGSRKQFILLSSLAGTPPGVGARIAHYDLEAKQWAYSAVRADDYWYYAAASAVDPVSKRILIVGLSTDANPGRVWLYDPVTETVATGPGVPDEVGYGNNLVYFPPNDKFYLMAQGSPTQVYEITIDRTNLSVSSVVLVPGTGAAPTTDEAGWAYDARNRVIGGGIKDGRFHTYDPLANRWTTSVMVPLPEVVGISIDSAMIGIPFFVALSISKRSKYGFTDVAINTST
jgi:hypothetical protein